MKRHELFDVLIRDIRDAQRDPSAWPDFELSWALLQFHYANWRQREYALAIHPDGLIQSGAVANYSELARLGNVTQARMTQIMNLLMLAPAIQEELLFLPRVEQGRDEVCSRDLQPVAGVVAWNGQSRIWIGLRN